MMSVESLVRFSKDWDEAMVRNSPDEISKFMSDDWVIVGTEGRNHIEDIISQSRQIG